MKRVAAIVLSLIFVWLQTLPSAPAISLPAPQVCACCDCQQMNCCVSETTPETPPPAALPAPSGIQPDWSVFTPTLVAWILPAANRSDISSSDAAPQPAPAVPLFTRHCARLI